MHKGVCVSGGGCCLFVCLYVCPSLPFSVYGSLDPLELELETAISCHVGAGYLTLVLWTSSLNYWALFLVPSLTSYSDPQPIHCPASPEMPLLPSSQTFPGFCGANCSMEFLHLCMWLSLYVLLSILHSGILLKNCCFSFSFS